MTLIEMVRIIRSLFYWFDDQGKQRTIGLLRAKKLAEHYRRAPISLRPQIAHDLMVAAIGGPHNVVRALYIHRAGGALASSDAPSHTYPIVGVEYWFEHRCIGQVYWDAEPSHRPNPFAGAPFVGDWEPQS